MIEEFIRALAVFGVLSFSWSFSPFSHFFTYIIYKFSSFYRTFLFMHQRSLGGFRLISGARSSSLVVFSFSCCIRDLQVGIRQGIGLVLTISPRAVQHEVLGGLPFPLPHHIQILHMLPYFFAKSYLPNLGCVLFFLQCVYFLFFHVHKFCLIWKTWQKHSFPICFPINTQWQLFRFCHLNVNLLIFS